MLYIPVYNMHHFLVSIQFIYSCNFSRVCTLLYYIILQKIIILVTDSCSYPWLHNIYDISKTESLQKEKKY
jgi:hypothetical protein